ncbi:MAG: hypothetical protein AAF530_07075 [Pseudomonadota bacterium]
MIFGFDSELGFRRLGCGSLCHASATAAIKTMTGKTMTTKTLGAAAMR